MLRGRHVRSGFVRQGPRPYRAGPIEPSPRGHQLVGDAARPAYIASRTFELRFAGGRPRLRERRPVSGFRGGPVPRAIPPAHGRRHTTNGVGRPRVQDARGRCRDVYVGSTAVLRDFLDRAAESSSRTAYRTIRDSIVLLGDVANGAAHTRPPGCRFAPDGFLWACA